MKSSTLVALLAAVLSLSLTACGAGMVADGSDGSAATSSDISNSASKGRYEIFVGNDGRYYFHLLASNGQKVLASQGYTSASGVKNGIESVKSNGANSARYQLRTAADGSEYFVLKAGNGRVIGVSQIYATQASAKAAITSVQNLVVATADVPVAAITGERFETFKGLDGKYYFDLHARNGEIVLQSQGYSSKSSATNATDSVSTNGANGSRYQVRTASNGQTYFVLKAGNGRVIGTSELYSTLDAAESGIDAVIRTVTDLDGK